MILSFGTLLVTLVILLNGDFLFFSFQLRRSRNFANLMKLPEETLKWKKIGMFRVNQSDSSNIFNAVLPGKQ